MIEGRAFRYLQSLLNELCKRLPDSLKLFQALQLLSPNIKYVGNNAFAKF
jgi:hypothetical protein